MNSWQWRMSETRYFLCCVLPCFLFGHRHADRQAREPTGLADRMCCRCGKWRHARSKRWMPYRQLKATP